MSHPATTEQAKPLTQPETETAPRRPRTVGGKGLRYLTGAHRTPREIKAALDGIPKGSVTARTAGSLRVQGSRRTIERERAAFERAVAEENSLPPED